MSLNTLFDSFLLSVLEPELANFARNMTSVFWPEELLPLIFAWLFGVRHGTLSFASDFISAYVFVSDIKKYKTHADAVCMCGGPVWSFSSLLVQS